MKTMSARIPGMANMDRLRLYSVAVRSARLIGIALIAALLPACPSTLPDYDYGREPDPRKAEYVIGVSDELSINVWKNAELSTHTTVRPDGTITMPLVGDLKAQGRTPSQLRAEITERLSQFVKDDSAVVSIAVTEVNSYRFTVTGEVVRAGV